MRHRRDLGRPEMKPPVPLMTLTCVIIGAALALSGTTAGQAPDARAQLEGTRPALESWVETRRIISKEKRDWALGKEMLGERIELVRRELESLRSKTAEAETSIAEADRKKAELSAETARLAEATDVLRQAVVLLEGRTRELLLRLPPPLQERVKLLSQRLPAASGDVKATLAERFQNIVGILNEVNKFNREITVTSELRVLQDGSTAEVTTLYVGIGHAYYASPDGKTAGIGTATADGWAWTPANEAAGEIAKAIAIQKNELVAGFVRLPIRIK